MNLLVGIVVAAAIVMMATAVRPRRPRVVDSVVQARSAVDRIDAVVTAVRQRRALRRPPAARAVAQWCDDITRQVRSGSSLRDAVTSTESDDPGIDQVLTSIRLSVERGSSVSQAVHRIEAPGQHLALALSVIATASRIGGPSAAAIDRTAMALRRRAAEIDDRSTQAAQARLSTHVMTALPLLMLAVLLATDADVRAVTVSPLGAACISAGLTLNLIGWWWMSRIIGTVR